MQAHANRKEVDGVPTSVKRILKAHDLAMNTQGENVNVRIVAARVQDQVTAVSNVLRSHETVLRIFFYDHKIGLAAWNMAKASP